MCTKVFSIAIALFVFWGGMVEAKNSSPKRAVVFDTSSPLLTTSTVDILEQHRWLGVSAVHGSYLGESLKKAGSFNPNDTEAYSDSEEAFERAGCALPILPMPISEVLWGSLAGFVGAIGGMSIGEVFAVNPPGDVVLFIAGNIIGSSSGVYLVGHSSGETGSYWATLIGSTLVTSSVVLLVALNYLSEESVVVFFIPGVILSAVGATIGFNLTKGKEQKNPAAINLEEGNISFAFPSLQMQVSQIPNHRPETDYTLRLVSARF
ncbi:hypothetical protein FJZ31_40865 [Candidatus Poribacteria bacterium]|nr:hypothetical protein [Candidatus Poribacteria bacterium]